MDTVMFEFIKKDDMIFKVEGFWEVKKNTYEKFTLLKDRGDPIMQVDYCECSGMIFPEAVVVTTEDVEIHQILQWSSDRTVQHLCLRPENEHERQLCKEFAPQPGGTNENDAHVCIACFIAEQNIIIKKKLPIYWRKEWQKFQSCKFIHIQYFYDNFILHCDFIQFTDMGIIVVRPPWVRCEFFAELPLVLIL